MKKARSEEAQKIWSWVQSLQKSFQDLLISCDSASTTQFTQTDWLRDGGDHGGGWRRVANDGGVFNRASINISHIQYGDLPEKNLDSATALSTIVHPSNPLAPSTHMHFSWTSLKKGNSYWRLMADLNPAISFEEDKNRFEDGFRKFAPDQFDEATAQGDKYFSIPELKRKRGVCHFYLEQYNSGNSDVDFQFADKFANGMIQTYGSILKNALESRIKFSDQNKQDQLAYHTAYLFQVLTLDRGTTAGLLAHNQNDLGILGSLPARIDRKILNSWKEKMNADRKALLSGIVNSIPEDGSIDDRSKLKLVESIREFYKKNPEALKKQASGFVIPPTAANHGK